MGNGSNGKTYCTLIGGYMVLKSAINLFLGFGAGNIVWLIVNIALAYTLVKALPYCNIVVGMFLAVMFLSNVSANISGHQWFYLGEGIIDAVCAVLLFINKDIKEHFGKN